MRTFWKWFGRILAGILIAAAVAALGYDLYGWGSTGTYRPLAAGELWFRLDSASLNLSQAVVQRYLHPALWDPVLVAVLRWPAFVMFGVPGAILALELRPRRRRRIFS